MNETTADTLENQLDEIIALAADAGRLNAEALVATVNHRRIARQAAQLAEQQLSAARARFLHAKAGGK